MEGSNERSPQWPSTSQRRRSEVRFFLFALTAAVSCASTAAAQQANNPPEHWYGWEIMLADGASLAVAVAGAAASSGSNDTPAHVLGYAGFAGFLAGSPLIHAVGHRQYGRAVLSFVLRDAPAIGAFVLANSCQGGFDVCTGEAWGSALLVLVAAAGVIVDWTALSWERVDAPSVAVVPLVGKHNGAALALRF